MPTTTTARIAEAAVSGTSYRITEPCTEKPSMAMKCIVQMPVPPIANAAPTSQNLVSRPRVSRAREVSRRPSIDPTLDMMYASTGVNSPKEK